MTTLTRPRTWPGLLLADLTALLFAFGLALWMLSIFRHERIGGDFVHWWRVEGDVQSVAFAVLALFCCLRFWVQGHYAMRLPFWDELLGVLKVVTSAAVMNVLAVVLVHGSVSRFLWPVSWVLVLLLLPLLRGVARYGLALAGHWTLPVVILGSGSNARAARQALHSEARLGFEVQTFLDLRNDPPATTLPAARVPLRQDEVLGWLQQQGCPHLVIALDADELERHASLVEQLYLKLGDVFLIPPVTGLPLLGLVPCHFFRQEVLMLSLGNNLGSLPRRCLKRSFDLVGAASGLLLLSPLLLWISWRVRRDGGPALFGQQRVGRHGRRFSCLKFRTMVPDAAERMQQLLQQDEGALHEWQATRKLRADPRITRFGEFLRRSSLDELPQLWNVLRGDMSLVGPRPVVADELARYGERASFYLQVRPGMSGLWQVSGRNDTTYDERVALDAWYIKNWSLWYDIAIVCKTVRVVLGGKGAY